jgi:hypothetical protein
MMESSVTIYLSLLTFSFSLSFLLNSGSTNNIHHKITGLTSSYPFDPSHLTSVQHFDTTTQDWRCYWDRLTK